MKLILLAIIAAIAFIKPQANAAETSEVFEGHTYVFVPREQGKNWQMAKRDAQERGGHLVVISSKAEQQFVEKLINKAMKNLPWPVWIGLTDEEGEGVWKWVTGEALTYTNWQRYQPSNSNSITPENYCVIWHSDKQSPPPNGYRGAKKGEWNDIAGDNVMPYIIEYDFVKK